MSCTYFVENIVVHNMYSGYNKCPRGIIRSILQAVALNIQPSIFKETRRISLSLWYNIIFH